MRGMGMQVSPAPEPRDIVWHNVARPQASGDGSFIRLIFAKCVHAMHDRITTEPTTVALSGWKRAISLYHPETARHNCWCVNSLWRLLSSLVPCQLWEFGREDSGRQLHSTKLRIPASSHSLTGKLENHEQTYFTDPG